MAKTPYVFILNPDTILAKNCIYELIKNSNKLSNNFAIISPFTTPPNYGYFEDIVEKRIGDKNIIDVDYVNGFSMLIKKSKINYFDDNIFLYLEEIDLCKRLKKKKEKIFIIKSSKIKHLAAKSSNIGFEFEKCRNWHWMWSKVYFNKKYTNFFVVYQRESGEDGIMNEEIYISTPALDEKLGKFYADKEMEMIQNSQ